MEYFCSQISRKLLENLTSEYIWMRTLQNQPEASLVEPLCTSCTKGFVNAMSRPPTGTSTSSNALISFSVSRGGRGGGGGRAIPRLTNTTTANNNDQSQMTQQQPLEESKSRTDELNNAIHHLKDIALEQLAESTLLETKKSIFS